MTLEQLKRADTINQYSMFWKEVKPINYSRFAILSDAEREDCLKAAETIIKKIKAKKRLMQLN